MTTSNETQTNLFSPIAFGNLELTNRIVMAPLTRNRAAEGNASYEDMNGVLPV